MRRARLIRGPLIALGVMAAVGAAGFAFVRANQYTPPQTRLTFTNAAPAPAADDLSWSTSGGDPAHLRYSALSQIDVANVGRLREAWRVRTGEVARLGPKLLRRSKFQATPILAAGLLVLCTPFNRIIALDPRTGSEVWAYDPAVDARVKPFNDFNCRGVAQWIAEKPTERDAPCGVRILAATNDRRLIALDARSGAACAQFGSNGQIIAIPEGETNFPGEVQIVAAPAVIGDTVIVGSSVADNQVTRAAPGAVRAFDVRSGHPRWKFDALGSDTTAGGANVWSSISTDAARDLVFLPTSSPSPDFYGTARNGDMSRANAIVAVRGGTGEVVWSFQAVRHDLWDYDVPAAPVPFDLRRGGTTIPALAFATKQGFVFVLHRETGAPLFDVVERAVPASDVPGERAAPTQPFSILPPIAPQHMTAADAFGVLGFDRMWCADRLSRHRNEGLFTPPSVQGTIVAPTTGGGANWGGVTIDPVRQLLLVNTSRAVEIVTLLPRRAVDAMPSDERSGVQPQRGAPYAATREVLRSPLGLPCNKPPWGALTAIDLSTGTRAWERPLGTTSKLAPWGLSFDWGTPNLGGSLATAGGLTFIAAAMDDRLRAFETSTGRAVWSADLPASAQATPMTYAIDGRQYVVIAAGGHSLLDTTRGDWVVAYALEART